MNEHDELATAQTRPSAPRVGAAAETILVSTRQETSLPVVKWSAAGVELAPSGLPRYETLDLLGEGGMGEVVRARDNDIGREVAVKRLRADLQHPELYARFVEEVRTVGQLEHPNIVPIHDAGVDAQGFFFVMKHVEGESMASLIKRLQQGDAAAHAKWPFERRVDVIRKVLEALRYAHSKGVIHRDLKPANILIGPMREVFLLDWGIAKRARNEPVGAGVAGAAGASVMATQVGAVMGTPLYMAPEQVRGEVADARTDLYGLSMAFYEFVTLRHPFEGMKNNAELMDAVLNKPVLHAGFVRGAHQPQVPMDLGWVLKKGLEKDPSRRFQSADELIQRLDDRAEGKVPIQCHVTATKRMNYEVMRLIQHHPLGFSAVLIGALASCAVLVSRAL